MREEDVQYIVEAVASNLKLDAIRCLRNHTHLGLIQAKAYIEAPNLATRLHQDFVMATADELNKARTELKRLVSHIKDLGLMEGLEHEQNIGFETTTMHFTLGELTILLNGLDVLLEQGELSDEHYLVANPLSHRLMARKRQLS